MSSGLSAIAKELRRLQRNGVDHVFIEDDTLQILNRNAAEAGDAAKSTNLKNAPNGRHEAVDLEAMVRKTAGKSFKKPGPPKAEPQKNKPFPSPPVVSLAEGDAAAQLESLEKQINSCETCRSQCSEGGKLVFGSGDPAADLFFCGEAPGAEEEATGQPFVGKAGQLLGKIITAMGLTREEVYLTNLLKWRPQHDKPYGNRPATAEEMNFCLPYLRAQIEIVRPKVVVALGNAAVRGLLGPDPNRKMRALRGTWSEFSETPLMITFHPSYLLQNGTLKTKRMLWEDMLQVMDKCGLPINDKQRGFFLPKD